MSQPEEYSADGPDEIAQLFNQIAAGFGSSKEGDPEKTPSSEADAVPRHVGDLSLSGAAMSGSNSESSGEDAPGKKFLHFRQKFDGSQPEAPQDVQEQVAVDFAGYLRNLYERIDPSVPAYSSDEAEKQSITQVSIDGQDARIVLTVNDEESEATISITAVIDGIDDEAVYYELQQDGVVRRYDQPVSDEERIRRQMRRDPNVWTSREEALFSMLETGKAASTAHAAQGTEEALGLNGQPISAQEFADLRHALDAALAK